MDLFFSLENRFINFAKIIPLAKELTKASAPRRIIFNVPIDKNISAVAEAPTESISKIVTVSQIYLEAASANLPVKPDSLRRLPNINIPIKGKV